MPRTSRGPYLYLRRERRDAAGRLTHAATWVIRDGKRDCGTGCARHDLRGAEEELKVYLAAKHATAARSADRDPRAIPLADVLNLYLRDVVPGHSRPRETIARLERIAGFFGDLTLADVNGERCRAYAAQRGSQSQARKELEDLRAAINHHRAEGHTDRVVSIVLPAKSEPRDEWLTRAEAARLVWAAWRYREVQKGVATDRRPLRHVARFILVGLYTGTRSGAICAAAFDRVSRAGYVDIQHGVFHRRPHGERITKKRKPPVRLPPRLLAHMRRWRANGQNFVVEWNGAPIQKLNRAFRHAVRIAGLRPTVTPHVLRHTAATWLMQRGVDLWLAAGYVGMTAETMQATYAHHHPDFQRDAADAITRKPPRAARSAS